MKRFPHIAIIFFMAFVYSCRDNSDGIVEDSNLTQLFGEVFGTSYNIIYSSKTDHQKGLDSLFHAINKSLSTYQEDSDISKLNRNEIIEVDSNFIKVYNSSKKIYQETEGAFDPTIGSVVNAWDFGPEGKIVSLDSVKIKNLMADVGLDKVSLNGNTIKKPDSTFLDFNAIAKGYAVDVVGEYLEKKQISNYLVEIGGEIRVLGRNIDKNSPWKVGIEEPHFDEERSIMRTLTLKDESMATSGVYRKFKVDENGNRYSHIIDAQTGYPSRTNILGISVIASNCMEADAYATAFKAMGIEKVKNFLENHPHLKVFIIFENSDGNFETISLNNFPE